MTKVYVLEITTSLDVDPSYENMRIYERMFTGFTLSHIILNKYSEFLYSIYGDNIRFYEYCYDVPYNPDDIYRIKEYLINNHESSIVDTDNTYKHEITQIEVYESERGVAHYLTEEVSELITAIHYNEKDVLYTIMELFDECFELIRTFKTDNRICNLKQLLLESIIPLMLDFYSEDNRLRIDPIELSTWYLTSNTILK